MQRILSLKIIQVGWRLHENKYEHRAEYHDHVNGHQYVVMCSGMQNKGSEVISSGEKMHSIVFSIEKGWKQLVYLCVVGA